jgi:hypothetical protein
MLSSPSVNRPRLPSKLWLYDLCVDCISLQDRICARDGHLYDLYVNCTLLYYSILDLLQHHVKGWQIWLKIVPPMYNLEISTAGQF